MTDLPHADRVGIIIMELTVNDRTLQSDTARVRNYKFSNFTSIAKCSLTVFLDVRVHCCHFCVLYTLIVDDVDTE